MPRRAAREDRPRRDPPPAVRVPWPVPAMRRAERHPRRGATSPPASRARRPASAPSPPFSKDRRSCLGPVQRTADSRRPVSSFRVRSNHGEGGVSPGETVRASMTESLPSPDSTLRSSRTVRPGCRSSSSSRSGHGARTFCTTAPASSGPSAWATSRSSLALSDTWKSPAPQKRNGPANRRAVRFSRRRVTATSASTTSSLPTSSQRASSSRSSSSWAPFVPPGCVFVTRAE